MQADVSILVGGDAGQGVESSGAGLCKAFARAGLHVFANQDFRSRIRNGHNFYQIRVGDRPLFAQRDPPDLLVALTAESVTIHKGRLASGAGVLYDESFSVDADALSALRLQPMPLPLRRIAGEHGDKMMLNTASLGAAAAVIKFPLVYIESVIRDNFAKLGDAVVEGNLAVAREAYELAARRYAGIGTHVPRGDGRARMVINGNQALALGALAGGCRLVAVYPMTPATSITEFIAGISARYGIATKHAEDEIAAVCMAIGASFAGVRAMTATSGGGLSLMVEALGLAGITEVPLVVVDVQRGGPSTGLPTRTEQSDLLFALHASQGEFPRIVTAPGTIEECFEAGWRASNLAERYQCPVLVLSDLTLATAIRAVDPEVFDFAAVPVDRGELLTGDALDGATGYRRFALTDDGISPRAIAGHPNSVYAASSDEHDERGHITEEIANRVAMFDKRMRKEATALCRDVRPPERYGPADAELTLVCWGSVYGTAREAADLLSAAGHRCAVLQFQDLWPFPVAAAEQALTSAGLTIGVEQNYTGQLAKLIRMATGRALDRRVYSYDGRPLAPEEVVAAVEKVLAGQEQVMVEAGVDDLTVSAGTDVWHRIVGVPVNV